MQWETNPTNTPMKWLMNCRKPGGDDPNAMAGSARHAGLAFVTDPNPAFDVSHVGQTRARARYAAWHGRCVAR
jgi:hypothetical protein